VRYCVFLENDKTNLRQIFFSGFKTIVHYDLQAMYPAFKVFVLLQLFSKNMLRDGTKTFLESNFFSVFSQIWKL